MSLYKLIFRCPVEIAMAIFFGLYLYLYGPYEQNASVTNESWPPQTRECAMTICLIVTMVVRIVVRKLSSSKYGLCASLAAGIISITLFLFHQTIDDFWLLPSFLIALIICFLISKGSIISRLKISIIQSFTTIGVYLLIYRIVNFVLEISKNVCLGPDDDLIASSYGIVGGAIGFIIIYELIDMYMFKYIDGNEK